MYHDCQVASGFPNFLVKMWTSVNVIHKMYGEAQIKPRKNLPFLKRRSYPKKNTRAMGRIIMINSCKISIGRFFGSNERSVAQARNIISIARKIANAAMMGR
jgi:hypothetical protein